MVLHAENRKLLVAEPLISSVIQVDVGDFHRRRIEGLRIHREAMVLRSDLDIAGQQILDRMVCPPMAELQLEGPSAERQSEKLVAQTNAEDRLLIDQQPETLDRVMNGGRISRSVREEDAVGIEGENVL